MAVWIFGSLDTCTWKCALSGHGTQAMMLQTLHVCLVNAAHMPWLVPRSSFANFFSDSWRIFGYDKIFCAHMHTADATDCLQNQHSHLIDSLCTLLSAAKSPTNTIAARTMIFGHSGLSILRCGCGYFISPPCMHMQIRGTVGSLRSCKPCCDAY